MEPRLDQLESESNDYEGTTWCLLDTNVTQHVAHVSQEGQDVAMTNMTTVQTLLDKPTSPWDVSRFVLTRTVRTVSHQARQTLWVPSCHSEQQSEELVMPTSK